MRCSCTTLLRQTFELQIHSYYLVSSLRLAHVILTPKWHCGLGWFSMCQGSLFIMGWAVAYSFSLKLFSRHLFLYKAKIFLKDKNFVGQKTHSLLKEKIHKNANLKLCVILLCLIHIHDVEQCSLYSKLTFLGYTFAFILGRKNNAHMVWKMVGRLRWCFSCRFPESSAGPKHVQLFFQAAGVTPGWTCKRHLWYHCPTATVSLLNDVARCWPIPGAKGHYITASFSWSWEKPFGFCIRGPLQRWAMFCLCDTVPSLICGLTSQDANPFKSILLCHGIVQGLREEYEGKVFFATLVLQGSAVCGAC